MENVRKQCIYSLSVTSFRSCDPHVFLLLDSCNIQFNGVRCHGIAEAGNSDRNIEWIRY